MREARQIGSGVALIYTLIILSSYQVYVWGVAEYTLSLYFLVSVSSLVVAAAGVGRHRNLVGGILLPFSVIVVVNVVYLVFSPDWREGVKYLLFSLPFGAILVILSRYLSERADGAKGVLIMYSLVAATQSVLTIIFMIDPALEMEFIYSDFARYVINPNTIDHLALVGSGNVLDVYKSGGFFDNGNLAAVYNELSASITACAAVMAARDGRRWQLRGLVILFLIHYVSIFATGSKSGAAIAIGMPFIWIVSMYIIRNQGRVDRIVFASIGVMLVGFCVLYFAPGVLSDSILENGARNAARRAVIWDVAWELFLDNPISGLGYGGWYEKFRDYGSGFSGMQVYGDMPAHNMLIIIWAETGIVSVLMVLLIFRFSLRSASKFGLLGRPELLMAAVIASNIIFIFIHSMIDNFIFYREPRLQLPCALVIAWMASWKARYVHPLKSLPNDRYQGQERRSKHEKLPLRPTP